MEAASEVALTVRDVVRAPVFVEVMVAVVRVFGATPVTETSPAESMVTDPPFVAVPDHVYRSSKLVISTVNPSEVGVCEVKPAANEVALTSFDPVGTPLFTASMVAVDSVLSATPVTETSPAESMATDPPFVAVPDQE
jgi:hypothetical protein